MVRVPHCPNQERELGVRKCMSVRETVLGRTIVRSHVWEAAGFLVDSISYQQCRTNQVQSSNRSRVKGKVNVLHRDRRKSIKTHHIRCMLTNFKKGFAGD